jgi:CubicO group peptidase (beta-lactamase class C family)
MRKLRSTTRRQALSALAAAPLLSLNYFSASAVSQRRWTITGTRVREFDGLDTAMQSFMQQYGVRAGSLSVARHSRILFQRAYTWAKQGYSITQPNSLFRLASVSKAFTAALIFELIQTQTIRRDLRVFPWLGYTSAILPDQHVNPRLMSITVQHLVDHYCGWDWTVANFDPMFRMREIARALHLSTGPSRWDIARLMVGEPLQSEPGAEYAYSNFGYLMLGLVAEKATSTNFLRLVRERVTCPLGIEDIFGARTRKEQRLPREVSYHNPWTGLTPEFPNREVRVPLAYGGEGWLTESMEPDGSLAATSAAVARLIGHYAVWGLGRRVYNNNRSGWMAGTSSYAESRSDELDFCFIFNTNNFPNDRVVYELAKKINHVLDSR